MAPTVAACQMAVADIDVTANLAAVEERVRGLADRVDVAVLPECVLTGFVADDRVREAALARDGPELGRVRDLAADRGLAVVVGYVERDSRAGDATLYNATAYVPPDDDPVVYRKRHLWGGERAVLAPGEELVTVETPLGTAGMVTCYDLNFVGDSAALADERVDALLVAAAWPAPYGRNWRLLARARALDGVRWTVGAARVGRREVPGARVVEYAGRSLVVRPDGEVHASLAAGERDVVADLDPGLLARQRDLVGVLDR